MLNLERGRVTGGLKLSFDFPFFFFEKKKHS